MRAQRIGLILSTLVAGGVAIQPVSADDNRGTMDQQMACTPDVWRLCSDQIPDKDRIVSCLRQNTPQLSGACRAVFESNDSMPQPRQANRRVLPRAAAPSASPRSYPAQQRSYDADNGAW
jgi:hypothetical protein